MKRVAVGLKMAFMLIFAIVAYAAVLKRGKIGTKAFSFVVAIGLASMLCVSAPFSSTAKAPPPKKSVPTGPPKQIYTRSERTLSSQILGASGKAAYIVSSVGTNSGILITDVTSGGVAANMGIGEGDVLLSINQRVVTTAPDADRILGDIPSGKIRVSFARQGDSGLQLYNLNVSYSHQGPPAGMPSSGAGSTSGGGGKSVGSQLASQIPSTESHMLGVINADRARQKAGQVSANGALASLARAHAQDMATRNFFNHVNPDGLNPTDRARKAGIKGVFENISYAKGVGDLISAADDAERQMMAEPPNQQNHRSNIIDPNHATVGVGIAVSKDGTLYMVQEFCDGSP